VLRQGLARDPDERYATVEDFRRELMSVLQPAAAAVDPLGLGRHSGADA
jgi:hypothetical protein